MKVTDFLATNLNKRDDKANQALALEIIKGSHCDWINELIENLNHKDKNIQSDCIKVLYEIGQNGAPQMIAPYLKDFYKILSSKNNRLIWGAMIAIDMIASIKPEEVYDLLPGIMLTIDKGSTITIDHGVAILAKLSESPDFSNRTFPLLLEQLKKCPAKQLPMYAEKSVTAINAKNQSQFINLLKSRISEADNDSQKNRIERVIKKLNK